METYKDKLFQASFINNTNTHYISEKTKNNKSLEISDFVYKQSHYYIMTEGGTPIYSRYGDESEISSILATLSAIITKFNYSGKAEQEIKSIQTKNEFIYFLKKGKLYFIGVNKCTSLNVLKLKNTLELLYFQLLSIITIDLIPSIERKPYSCADAMGGTETLFEQTISYSHSNLPCMLGCYEVLIFDKESRTKLYSILKRNLGNALLCLCLTKQGIISYAKGSYIQNLSYNDVILIYNMIHASEGLLNTESWVPICVPGISETGYLQMYCNFYQIEGNIPLGMVFITESQDGNYFMNFSEQSRRIYEECILSQLINEMENENPNLDYLLPTESAKGFITKTGKKTSKLHNAFIYLRKKCDLNSFEDSDNKLLDDLISKLSFSYSKIKISGDLFDEANYIACKNKTLNQCVTKGFDDYDNERKQLEKRIKLEFVNLYEKIISNLDKKSSFIIEMNKATSSNLAVYESDNLILFASFSYFKDMNDIQNIMNSIMKQIKTNLEQYFCVE